MSKKAALTAIRAPLDVYKRQVWGEVSPENIRKVAAEFGGVEHRTELVREFEGVKYYNDSIASSPTRTISGTLSLFDKKIILICGG